MQVNLTPLGARRILGVPMHELENREVALERRARARVERLEERLFETRDWETRLVLVEMLPRGAAGRSAAGASRRRLGVAAAGGDRAAGSASTRWPASSRCSRKHLVAQFREHVGPPPKTAARILRFNHLLRLLDRRPRLGWAELAARCGYYDQAHLNREVRRLAGCTPRELAGEPPVTFVQDALAAAS